MAAENLKIYPIRLNICLQKFFESQITDLTFDPRNPV